MMMRQFIFLGLIAMTSVNWGQTYSTKSGTLSFEASVPSFEEVSAKNESVSAIFKTETGTFACLTLVKGFRFKVALMEEHFNENYIESSKFPKTTFKGTIVVFDLKTLNDTEQSFIAKGTLSLHGVEKQVEIPVQLGINGDALVMSSQFNLKPEDFNIKIPKVVSSKIAEDIEVVLELVLKN